MCKIRRQIRNYMAAKNLSTCDPQPDECSWKIRHLFGRDTSFSPFYLCLEWKAFREGSPRKLIYFPGKFWRGERTHPYEPRTRLALRSFHGSDVMLEHVALNQRGGPFSCVPPPVLHFALPINHDL